METATLTLRERARVALQRQRDNEAVSNLARAREAALQLQRELAKLGIEAATPAGSQWTADGITLGVTHEFGWWQLRLWTRCTGGCQRFVAGPAVHSLAQLGELLEAIEEEGYECDQCGPAPVKQPATEERLLSALREFVREEVCNA